MVHCMSSQLVLAPPQPTASSGRPLILAPGGMAGKPRRLILTPPSTTYNSVAVSGRADTAPPLATLNRAQSPGHHWWDQPWASSSAVAGNGAMDLLFDIRKSYAKDGERRAA